MHDLGGTPPRSPALPPATAHTRRPGFAAPAAPRALSSRPTVTVREERGQRTCPGSCVGTSGGRQLGRAAEVEATCSSKLLMRGFLVGSGLASGVTLLRLMSGLGAFFAS